MVTISDAGVDWGTLNWTAIVVLLVFIVGKIYELIAIWLRQKRARKNLAKALMAEISAMLGNLAELSDEDFEEINRNYDFGSASATLSSYASTKVYDANVGNIALFPAELVGSIVALYIVTEEINAGLITLAAEDFSGAPEAYKNIAIATTRKDIQKQRELTQQVMSDLPEYIQR